MRKLTKVVSGAAVVVTMGTLMSVVHASPPPPDIAPARVKELYHLNFKYTNPPQTFWGHKTEYFLYVEDNQKSPELYPNCTVQERFSNYLANPTYTADLTGDTPPAPGIADSQSTTTGYFEDDNKWNTSGWPTADNHDTGNDTFWFSFDQTFDVYRNSDMHPFIGVDKHHITHTQGMAYRTGAN